MKGIVTVLADKEQAMLRTIAITDMSTHGTRLARIVGINFDSYLRVRRCFVSNHTLQFGKGPLRVCSISFALLLACTLSLASFRSLSDVCQFFQADQAVWVLFHDAFSIVSVKR